MGYWRTSKDGKLRCSFEITLSPRRKAALEKQATTRGFTVNQCMRAIIKEALDKEEYDVFVTDSVPHSGT